VFDPKDAPALHQQAMIDATTRALAVMADEHGDDAARAGLALALVAGVHGVRLPLWWLERRR
jgi:hypothetical protein